MISRVIQKDDPKSYLPWLNRQRMDEGRKGQAEKMDYTLCKKEDQRLMDLTWEGNVLEDKMFTTVVGKQHDVMV